MQFSRPVRLRVGLNTNMEMFGSKEPFKAVYRVRNLICSIRLSFTGNLWKRE